MEDQIKSKDSILTEVVTLYGDSMFSWAVYKTSNKEAAEDLVQDTFLAATKGLESFKSKSTIKTWIYSILNNKIAGYHRQKIKKGIDSSIELKPDFFNEKGRWDDSHKPQNWEAEKNHLLDDTSFNEVLSDCMQILPESWASALSLKYLSEKKGSEICQDLGISETNYWQILHRGKLQVRECLESKWFSAK